MANRVTQPERDRLNRRAAELYAQHRSQSAAVAALIRETGVSRDRARTAVARAALKANRPRR